MIDDMKVLFAFLASPSFSSTYLPRNITLNPSRIAITASSGGGYPARAAALYAEPKPVAFLSQFGMGGEFLSDHWVKVQTGSMKFAGLDSNNINEEKVAPLLGDIPPTSDAPLVLLPNKTVEDKEGRINLFLHWWKRGEFLDHVLGHPVSEALREMSSYEARTSNIPKALLPALLEAQIDSSFPPTYLIHGAFDPIVLPSESEATYKRLKELGVEVELDIVDGAVHGLMDTNIPPALVTGGAAAQQRGFRFLQMKLMGE